MNVMEKLEAYLTVMKNYTTCLPEHKRTYEDHAFGAVEMAMLLDPERSDTYEKMWENFKKTLDSLTQE